MTSAQQFVDMVQTLLICSFLIVFPLYSAGPDKPPGIVGCLVLILWILGLLLLMGILIAATANHAFQLGPIRIDFYLR